MADIFLSYAREDREKAERLAEALEGQGWSVFWDLTIPAGESWDTYIGRELGKARCVVVAWSKAAVESEWVREQARAVKKKGALIPVLFGAVEPPFGFGGIQAVDLSDWTGREEAAPFQSLLKSLVRKLGPSSSETGAPPAPHRAVAEEKGTVEAREAAYDLRNTLTALLIEFLVETEVWDYSQKVRVRISQRIEDRTVPVLEIDKVLVGKLDSGEAIRGACSLIEETVRAIVANDDWQELSMEQRLVVQANRLAGSYFRTIDPRYDSLGTNFLDALEAADWQSLKQLHATAAMQYADHVLDSERNRVRTSGGDLFWTSETVAGRGEARTRVRVYASQKIERFSLRFHFQDPILSADAVLAGGKAGDLGPPKIRDRDAYLRYGNLGLEPGKILIVDFRLAGDTGGGPEVTWWQ